MFAIRELRQDLECYLGSRGRMSGGEALHSCMCACMRACACVCKCLHMSVRARMRMRVRDKLPRATLAHFSAR